MIHEATETLSRKIDLSYSQMEAVMEEIMTGKAQTAEIVSFLTALNHKGETLDEIIAAVKVMRGHATKVRVNKDVILDTCGTGGDVSHTFNISTISAIIAAAAEVTIAKHGNRSVSSKCGSADLLESLGLNLELSPQKVEECINEVGFGFIFAQQFHRSMKHAAPVRRELGIRTVFNILGPLTNPAGAQAQLLGVFDEKLTETMAHVLKNLGSSEAMVVHGMDGLDEISISGKTKISHLKDGKIRTYFIEPADFSMNEGNKEELVVHGIEEGKLLAESILGGDEAGTRRNIVLLNAAAAIMLGKKAKDMKEGIRVASEVLSSGKAMKKLKAIIEFSRK